MPKFNKTNRTAEELLVVLKRKGLSIADEAKSITYLRNIGYYRLKAYFYPLYQEPKHKHLFKVNATFDKVMNMYRFDRKLRLLLFNEMEKIEVAFRSVIVNIVTDELGVSIGRVSRYGVNILAIELFEDYKTTKPQVRLYSFPSSLHPFITITLNPKQPTTKNP